MLSSSSVPQESASAHGSREKKNLTITGRLAPRAVRMLHEITSYAELLWKRPAPRKPSRRFSRSGDFAYGAAWPGWRRPSGRSFAFGKGRPASRSCARWTPARAGTRVRAQHRGGGVGVRRRGAGGVRERCLPGGEGDRPRDPRRGNGVRQGPDGRTGGLPGNRRGDDGPPVLPRHVAKGCLALAKLHFTYHGRAAHAAAYPEHGINALDGVLSSSTASPRCASSFRTPCAFTASSPKGTRPNIIPSARRRTLRAGRDARRDARCGRAREGLRRRRGDGLPLPARSGGGGVRPFADEGESDPGRRLPGRAGASRTSGERRSDEPEPRLLRHRKRLQVVPTLQPNVPITSGARVEIHTAPSRRRRRNRTASKDDGGDPGARTHRVRPFLRSVRVREHGKRSAGRVMRGGRS